MVANTELQRVGLNGWRTGMANLLRKENRACWASRRWLVKIVLWIVGINGFTALIMIVIPQYSSEDPIHWGVQGLFKLGPLALAFGTIIMLQDAIIGERQLGVTEWLLSKPMSRPAYVLSKLLANGLGILVIQVGLQGAVGYGVLWLVMGEPFPLPPYLVGMAGLAVHTLFYLALTLMMGVLTANRRALLGVSQGVLLGGSLVLYVPGTAMMATPWGLVNVLPAAVLGMPLPLSIWLPIGVTAILSVVCVAVALARFERLEF
jgi:ABC-type transport system involved in multi-copper enzyme maturation permease subunit